MKPELYAIVGMKFRGTEGLVAALPNGEPLELKREPENEADVRAVQVWARGQHVGYIRAAQNAKLAHALDTGAKFIARLHRSDPKRWPLVEVEGMP
jgi:HIRAN domain